MKLFNFLKYIPDLDTFFAKFPSYVAKPYLLWMKDRKTQAGVEYLPIYMASCLAES